MFQDYERAKAPPYTLTIVFDRNGQPINLHDYGTYMIAMSRTYKVTNVTGKPTHVEGLGGKLFD